MSAVIRASIAQYRLLRSDKELLDQTLKGSIKILTDILSLVNPTAFGRASRIRRYTLQLAKFLGLTDTWMLEMAAMLSQIGFVALSPTILDKVYIMEKLTDEEMAAFREYPILGADMIREIPRMESVAQIIERQLWNFNKFPGGTEVSYDDKMIASSAQILRVILDFDERISRGLSIDASVAIMENKKGIFNPKLVQLLRKINVDQGFSTRREMRVDELGKDMITLEEIRSKTGSLLVPKYQEITPLIIERLVRYKHELGVREPIPVAFNELKKED